MYLGDFIRSEGRYTTIFNKCFITFPDESGTERSCADEGNLVQNVLVRKTEVTLHNYDCPTCLQL